MAFSFFGCKKETYVPIECMDFHQLVAKNDINRVEYHLKNGMNPNCIINAGVTPIMTAAVYNRTDVIDFLVSYNAEINKQTDSGWTALLYAAENGNYQTVDLLIKRGANINLRLKGGENALTQACYKGHFKVAKLLLDKGIDVNTSDNEIGLNALIMTSDVGNLELVKTILPLTDNIDHQNKYGETALMRAAMKGHYDVAKYLLEMKSNKAIKDTFGNDALFYANKFDQQRLVELLSN